MTSSSTTSRVTFVHSPTVLIIEIFRPLGSGSIASVMGANSAQFEPQFYRNVRSCFCHSRTIGNKDELVLKLVISPHKMTFYKSFIGFRWKFMKIMRFRNFNFLHSEIIEDFLAFKIFLCWNVLLSDYKFQCHLWCLVKTVMFWKIFLTSQFGFDDFVKRNRIFWIKNEGKLSIFVRSKVSVLKTSVNRKCKRNVSRPYQ